MAFEFSDEDTESIQAAKLAKEMGATDAQAAKIVEIDLERLAKAYINIRDAKAKAAREAKEQEDKFNAKLALIQSAVLDFMNKTKQTNAKTEVGTFYKQLDIKPTGSDWEAFYKWVKENDAFDFLERRIKKTEVADWMEAHDGEAPPGVSVLREYVIRVRQS